MLAIDSKETTDNICIPCRCNDGEEKISQGVFEKDMRIELRECRIDVKNSHTCFDANNIFLIKSKTW